MVVLPLRLGFGSLGLALLVGLGGFVVPLRLFLPTVYAKLHQLHKSVARRTGSSAEDREPTRTNHPSIVPATADRATEATPGTWLRWGLGA